MVKHSIDHELKCLQPHFDLVAASIKSFELRENDRDFRTGDIILLREYTEKGDYTGKECIIEVKHILLQHPGLMPGYCMMSCELWNGGIEL